MALTTKGITIAFGTSSFTANVHSMTPEGFTRPVIGSSYFAQSGAYALKIPGTLVDAQSIEFEIEFDPDDEPPITAAAETLTITFPVPTGKSTGATLAGTGFISEFSFEAESIKDGEDAMLVGSFTWTWDGATVPTWTDSAI